MRVPVHKDYIHGCLEPIDASPGLKGKQGQRLRRAIADCLAVPPADSGTPTTQQLVSDLSANSPFIKAAVSRVIARQLRREVAPRDFELEVEQIDDEDVLTRTNLEQVLGIDALARHKLVERGLLAVGGLNQRLELMRRFDAVSGFQGDEAPLFEQKLGFLARMLDPDVNQEQLGRVIELAGLPTVQPGPDVRDLDLARLARAFRDLC